MAQRRSTVLRKTKETQIRVVLNLDGRGRSRVRTGVGFLDHMLESWAKHGLFDLDLQAKGDLHIDVHHTNEDVGLALGQAFRKALGSKRGIRRFGWMAVPLDEALVRVALDVSGRPYLEETVACEKTSQMLERARVDSGKVRRDAYAFGDVRHFLRSFANEVGLNLNVCIESGKDFHHVTEALFKALGRSLGDATRIDPRVAGVASTKGNL